MTQSTARQMGQTQGKLMLVEQAVYTCSYEGCARAFKTKFALKRHRLVHTQARDCVCPYCGKTFSLPQYMREHTYTHTREKPYVCGIAGCQIRFRQAGKLSLHRRTHPEYNVKRYNFSLNPKAKSLSRARSSREVSQDQHPGAASFAPNMELMGEAQNNKKPHGDEVPRAEETEKIHDTHEGVLSVESDHVTTWPVLAHDSKGAEAHSSQKDRLPSINLFFAPKSSDAALLKIGKGLMGLEQCGVPEHIAHYILPMTKCLPWLTLPYRPLFRPLLPLPSEQTHHTTSHNEQSWPK